MVLIWFNLEFDKNILFGKLYCYWPWVAGACSEGRVMCRRRQAATTIILTAADWKVRESVALFVSGSRWCSEWGRLGSLGVAAGQLEQLVWSWLKLVYWSLQSQSCSVEKTWNSLHARILTGGQTDSERYTWKVALPNTKHSLPNME